MATATGLPPARPLEIDSVRIDGGTQIRLEIDNAYVAELREVIKASQYVPPIVVFFDGSVHWLADGFHRWHAHRQAGATAISAVVKAGSQREAVLYALGCNSEHGLRRTPEDKRHALEIVLKDAEWSTRSSSWIAQTCRVSHTFVDKVRPLIESDLQRCKSNGDGDGQTEAAPVIREGKDGRKINTANIGRKAKPKPEPDPATIPMEEPPASDEPATVPFLSRVNGTPVADPPDVAKLRAAGKIAPGAVVEITEPDESQPTALEVVEEAREDDATRDGGISDEDWLEELPLSSVLCGISLRNFKEDALRYRHLEAARATFARQVGREIPRSARRVGPFARLLLRALKAPHPKAWVKCTSVENGGCDGVGTVPLLGECPKCRGNGFWIL